MNTVDLSLIHSYGTNLLKAETEKKGEEDECGYEDVNGVPGHLTDFCDNLGDQECGWVPRGGLKDQNHLFLG